jgi:hypothetical protein
MGRIADLIEKSFRDTKIKVTCDNICDDCMRQSPIPAEKKIKKHIAKIGRGLIRKYQKELNEGANDESQMDNVSVDNRLGRIDGVKELLARIKKL